MRAKKAKALRKIAREQTLGAPEVEYVASKSHPGMSVYNSHYNPATTVPSRKPKY